MIKIFEYTIKYVFRERNVTFHPPYKNCVLAISIRGKMNTKGTGMRVIPIKIGLPSRLKNNQNIDIFCTSAV